METVSVQYLCHILGRIVKVNSFDSFTVCLMFLFSDTIQCTMYNTIFVISYKLGLATLALFLSLQEASLVNQLYPPQVIRIPKRYNM